MRMILIAGCLAFGLGTANAGMMPAFQGYLEQYNGAKSALEARKGSLKADQYQRMSTALESGKKRMETGVGNMTREAYYDLARRESVAVQQIRAQLGQ
ncbi:MAG: hypothetical protein ACRCTI_10175 [Beijerinckiaceae bacterium]